ncbi:MAG: hypothetical protein GF418_12255 [Chitinivibrionales bacterium]|nr:hypothetical protein [Chitinivibrionales bacterium]MBD3396391.1 hypothetical protein [Chitinivibrionales bacterium]
MLTVKAAKAIGGRIVLPPSPDLLLLSSVTALGAGRPMRIAPVVSCPLTEGLRELLAPALDIAPEGDQWRVTPRQDDDAGSITLPAASFRFRDFIVFLLLGLKKDIVFAQTPAKAIARWQSLARSAGCEIVSKDRNGGAALSLMSSEAFAIPAAADADALHALLGLAMGLRRRISHQIDFHFPSPLRILLPALGYAFTLKSAGEGAENEALAKRMRFLRARKKSDQGVSYLLNADFSAGSNDEAAITLPGDDILGSILLAAKGLVQRGNLVVENMPLEPWATPVLSLLRKMGCRPAVQETGATSGGRVGMIQLQRFDLLGRKTDCTPLYQYAAHIPSMVVLACFAQGQSVLRGLGALRDDEPDGIERILTCVRALGGRHGEMPDGIVIDGAKQLDGFDLDDDLPPSLGGAFAVAGLKCLGATSIADTGLSQRWPGFAAMLDEIGEYRK